MDFMTTFLPVLITIGIGVVTACLLYGCDYCCSDF